MTEATQAPSTWWATDDFSVRSGCRVTPLVDGHAAMLAMCKAFLSAKEYILLAGWDIRSDLPMVRGEDVHVGAQGSPEQRALLASLREAGLDQKALAFWDAGHLRVMDVLGFATARGVRVGVLLWDAFHLGSHLTNDPDKEREALEAAGVNVLLDDSSRKVEHITQSLHQKCALVDGRIAFVGGIDLTFQEDGDYDRWDTHGHLCSSPERTPSKSAPSHPWHDVHVQLEGPIVSDVLRNITERWREVAERQHGPTWPARLALGARPQLSNGVPAQLVRTIPPDTYSFAPKGIHTIFDVYLGAIAHARRYIYLESQYFWQHVYVGLDDKRWGGHNPQMTQLLEALAAAVERGVRVVLVVPDHPNCGRGFTDDGIDWLRERARAANAAGRFDVYTLGNGEELRGRPGYMYYRPIYVHAKVAVIDDEWWTAGSANLNSRGMYSDAEINVAVLDSRSASGLRTRLLTEHIHPAPHEENRLADPFEAFTLMGARAAENAEHVRRNEPLVGHVLPYITAEQARLEKLPVDNDQGWLDNLDGGAGALPEKYAHRYL